MSGNQYTQEFDGVSLYEVRIKETQELPNLTCFKSPYSRRIGAFDIT